MSKEKSVALRTSQLRTSESRIMLEDMLYSYVISKLKLQISKMHLRF